MSARIVVVEDEPGTRRFVTKTLTDRGYDVAAFARVADATPRVLVGDLDLLLVDVELPDGCGLDLISLLPRSAHVPAIVMSGLGSEVDFDRGFAAGAADYIEKPFSAGELLSRVHRHAERGLAERASDSSGARRFLEGEAESDEPLVYGRYRIIRELGRGSYGQVFLARDAARKGQRVALKVLAPPPGEERDAKLRFIRETLTLQRVQHPGVVRVLDVGENDGRLWFAMEHVPGTTLEDYVDEAGPLSEADARTVAAGLLDALAALRAAGVTHRDVKPSNVILRGNDLSRPVLIDFGLATNQGDRRSTRAGISIGTPAYMAPEVARGDQADHLSDVFSLGLTLRFAITGADVCDETTVSEILQNRVVAPVPLPPVALSESFALFLGWLWASDRSSRAPSAVAARRALDAIESRVAASAPGEPPLACAS